MIKKLHAIVLPILTMSTLGLLLSAFSYDGYAQQHPEIQQSLAVTNGDPVAIQKICKTITAPGLANFMSVFVSSTFLLILISLLVWASGLRKPLPKYLRLILLIVIIVAGISFTVVQVWEPDFPFIICNLVA